MVSVRALISRKLASHYLFSALDEKQLERVAASAYHSTFDAGQTLFNQGDPAPVFYIVVEGSLKLYRVSASGHEKIMRFVGPGQSFAESVMFMPKPCYPVQAEGVEPGSVVSVGSETFLAILRDSFETFCAVAGKMTQRIRGHWDEIEALTLQNSRFRVVHYLLEHLSTGVGESGHVALPARKSLIATQLAVTPETFSRVLRQLADNGLIEIDGYHLHVPSVANLRNELLKSE